MEPWAGRARSGGWRLSRLTWAPHRLGFFLALWVLLCSSAWWAVEQAGRWWGWGLPHTLSPSLVHAAAMVFGAMPLFFAAFMFTAGPKWLGVEPPQVRSLLAPLLLQTFGWTVWLLGGWVAEWVAVCGVVNATVGLAWMQAMFLRLVRRSPAPDRLHAVLLVWAGVWGLLSMLGLVVAVWAGAVDLALLAVRVGLWGCVGVTFVVVLHRMLPFFTSSALPMVQVWRPLWVLWFLMAVMGLELWAAVRMWWLSSGPGAGSGVRVGMLVLGMAELAAGSVVLWLAVAWGLVQSLRIRLLAMLHLGFLWLGLSLLLSGASQLMGLREGVPVLGLGALHAMTMGFLGSLLLAMVTRVSCGHGGRPLVADNVVWPLFWMLQVGVLLRIAASATGIWSGLMPVAALTWLAVVGVWGLRLMNWMGRPRADGRPG
jgi:uncharacterized protein involved in response to NO